MLPTWTEPDEVDRRSRCWSRRPPAAAAGACAIVRDRATWPRRSRRPGARPQSAFGDGTVFCERYVETRPATSRCRSSADAHGNVVALGERECSIQRRHQKIVEEAPSPAVDAQLRERLCQAAIAAGPGGRLRRRRHGRVPARADGRVLLPGDEHPAAGRAPGHRVRVTGLDLVRLQLLVAEGGRCRSPAPPPMRGHAIEVRLYAEDPAHGWLPATGTLHRVRGARRRRRVRPLRRRGCGSTPGWTTARWSACTTTRCWPS